MPNDPLQHVAIALVEQYRAIAARLSGDPDQPTACTICGGTLPLWESLLVTQLTGTPVHVQCPPDLLEKRLREVGPNPEFPYDAFSLAVSQRMNRPVLQVKTGIIERTR